jgi:hypothetical protein
VPATTFLQLLVASFPVEGGADVQADIRFVAFAILVLADRKPFCYVANTSPGPTRRRPRPRGTGRPSPPHADTDVSNAPFDRQCFPAQSYLDEQANRRSGRGPCQAYIRLSEYILEGT